MSFTLAAVPGEVLEFDVPPSDLPTALNAFSVQSGKLFLSLYDDVKSIKTKGVTGSHSVESALVKLLEGTGLQTQFTDEGVITVVIAPESNSIEPEGDPMNLKKQKQGLFAGMLAALVGSPGFAQSETSEMEEVLVTGSFIKRASQADSVSPITNIGKDIIDDAGIITLSELFRWEPSNTGSTNQANISGQTDTGGTANVNLRGLGIGTTLVLVNGRRHTETGAVTNAGESFVDISSLMPMIMLDNVEILKDGAAATYGSDAIGGVVNYKTRNTFEGFELRFDNQFTSRSDDHEDTEFAAIWGAANDRTNVVAAVSWFERDPYEVQDRPGNRTVSRTTSGFGNPGTYTFRQDAVSGTYAGLAEGSRVPDPFCGSATDSFVSGGSGPFSEGGTCRYDFGEGLLLAGDERRIQSYAVATHQLNDKHTVFAEFGYTDQEFNTRVPVSLPILTAPSPVVSASHPGNPFGVDVSASLRPFGTGLGEPGSAAFERTIQLNSQRIVVGAEGDIADSSWTYNAAYTYSQNRYSTKQPDQLGSRLNLALQGFGGVDCDVRGGTAGADGCLYYNPFGSNYTAAPGSVLANSPELINWLTADNATVTDTELETYDFVFAGDVTELAAGPLSLAAGYQYRKDTRTTDRSAEAELEDLQFYGGGPDYSASRQVDALFTEVFIPVLGSDGGPRLDVQLAARYEDYNLGFDSTDSKLGVLYKHNDRFSARATFGTAFRAPTTFQIAGENTVPRALNDDFNGTRGTVGQTTAPSPDLQPEEAESMNLGITVAALDNLEFGLDYYNIQIDDRFATESQQGLVAADSASLTAAGCTVATLSTAPCLAAANPSVIRDLTTGDVTRVLARRFNAASVDTSGIDFTMNWSLDTDLGTFSIFNASTFILDFEAQESAGAETIDLAGQRNQRGAGSSLARSLPELRSNTMFSWARDNHRTTFTLRHIDGYEESNDHKIESWTVGDLQYNYSTALFGENELTLTVGALNISDEDPPEAEVTPSYGYDPVVADARGRMWYISLKYYIP